MRVFIVASAVLCASGAQAQLVNFTNTFDGSVNGMPVAASGSGQVDIDANGQSNASVSFSLVPGSFNPLTVSLISNLCSNAFRDDGDPDNLWALGGGNYQTSRVFQWIGVPNSMMTIDSTVTELEGALTSSSTISGTYNGPNDIIGIQDYSISWLPSSAPGEFFEAGTVVLERSTGDTLIMQFATVFSGLENDLKQPQFGVGTFDADWDGTTLTLGWDGEFMIPAPGAASVLVFAGVAAARRRR